MLRNIGLTFFIFLGLLVSVVDVSLVQAETDSYTCTVDRSRLDWRIDASSGSDTVKQCVIPKFDLSKGTLTQVDIQAHGRTDSIQKVENKDETPHTMTAKVDVNVELLLPDLSGGLLDLTITGEDQSYYAAAFDGLIDYSGTSGYTFPTLFAENSKSVSYTDDLNQFAGSGYLIYPVYANAISTYDASGNAAYEVDTYASVDVTVQYSFVPHAPDLILNACQSLSIPQDGQVEIIIGGANTGTLATNQPINLEITLPQCLSFVSTRSEYWSCLDSLESNKLICTYTGTVPVMASVPELSVKVAADSCAENTTYDVKYLTGGELVVNNNDIRCNTTILSNQTYVSPTPQVLAEIVTPTPVQTKAQGNEVCDDTKLYVEGHVFIDTNKNGTQDQDEKDASNIKVIITGGSGDVYEVETDYKGDYQACVDPGKVWTRVDLTDDDLPKNPIVTTKTSDGSTNEEQTKSAVAGENVKFPDVGVANEGSVLASAGVFVLAGILGGFGILAAVFALRRKGSAGSSSEAVS